MKEKAIEIIRQTIEQVGDKYDYENIVKAIGFDSDFRTPTQIYGNVAVFDGFAIGNLKLYGNSYQFNLFTPDTDSFEVVEFIP